MIKSVMLDKDNLVISMSQNDFLTISDKERNIFSLGCSIINHLMDMVSSAELKCDADDIKKCIALINTWKTLPMQDIIPSLMLLPEQTRNKFMEHTDGGENA